MPREKDAYDLAVAELSRPGADISLAWLNPESVRGGCLFAYVGTGCPTLVKYAQRVPDRDYRAIRGVGNLIRTSDIPDADTKIRPRHLRAFARIQRRADVLARRVPPDRETLLARDRGPIMALAARQAARSK